MDVPDAAEANPSPIDDLLCFLIHSTGFAFDRLYRKPLERLGLTYPQYLVMLALWDEDAMTVGRIGERLRLDSGTISPLVKRLIAAGLVTRERSAADERRVIVRLTEKGRRLRDGSAGVVACVSEAVGLDPAEMSDLMRRIATLRDRLDAAAP